MNNPFLTGSYGGEPIGSVDASSRLYAVRRFDAAQCRAALQVPDLQQTVRTALERRLRRLAKEKSR